MEPRQPGAQTEAIWEAVLSTYANGTARSEGDITLEANRLTGIGDQRARATVTLLTGRSLAKLPFRESWLQALRLKWRMAFCSAVSPSQCPDSVTTSYLVLDDPVFHDDTSAVLEVHDVAINPAACRGELGYGSSMGGDMNLSIEVHRGGTGWSVARSTMTSAGTTICNNPTPEEAARGRRLESEDSVVRATASPIAGTYRFVVSLPSGESTVVYSRTELHPMSPIRAWKQDDVIATGIPITGYDLMAVCALSESALPESYGASGRNTVTCYHSVSLAPTSQGRDSTTWRGSPEAELAAWILREQEPIGTRLHDALPGDNDVDSLAYYMPGYWVTYPSGRVRFEWTVRRGRSLLISIKGERISSAVLAGRSR